EQLERPGAGGARPEAAASGQDLGDLAAHGVDRIERVHGALRHVGDVAPAMPAHAGFPVDGLALEYDAPAGTPAVLRQHAHDGAHSGGLAAARLAHQADDAAMRHGEARAVDRAPRAGGRAVGDANPVDLEDHRAPRHRPPGLGIKPSSNPRRMKKPATTTRMMHRPGGTNQAYWPRDRACEVKASCSIMPHDTLSGSPKPRKLTLASVMMAQPMAMAA